MKYKIDKTDITPIGKLRTEFLIQLGLKILDAGNLLKDLENIPQTETIKGYVADFIVDKVFFIETASKSKDDSYDLQQQRVYAYYKALLNYFHKEQSK